LEEAPTFGAHQQSPTTAEASLWSSRARPGDGSADELRLIVHLELRGQEPAVVVVLAVHISSVHGDSVSLSRFNDVCGGSCR